MSKLIYFSATGSTKRVLEQIASGAQSIDATKQLTNAINIPEGELAVFGAPVFGGRIPESFEKNIKQISGRGNAVAVVVYGGRAYEDALLELCDLIKEQGFKVIAAAAFVAEHSMVGEIAAGRPDAADNKAAIEFSNAIKAKLESGNLAMKDTIDGNRPYKARGVSSAFTPLTDDSCTMCMICANECPVDAISFDDPKMTDNTKCIACACCIHICPSESRHYSAEAYNMIRERLLKVCPPRADIKIFI